MRCLHKSFHAALSNAKISEGDDNDNEAQSWIIHK